MAQFDQRGQQVHMQYNAGQDMYLGGGHDASALAANLTKLHQEFMQIKSAGMLDQQSASEVERCLVKAREEAQKARPDQKTVLNYLNMAKSFVEDVTAMSSFVPLLLNAIESVRRSL